MKGSEKVKVFKKIKYENVLLIPLLAYTIIGIIKAHSDFRITALIIYSLFSYMVYTSIKTSRIQIKRKGFKNILTEIKKTLFN